MTGIIKYTQISAFLLSFSMILMLISGCGDGTEYSNSLAMQGLKGNVKSIEETSFWVGGDGVVDESKVLEDNIYRYDENGNLTEHAMSASMLVHYYNNIYDDDGNLKWVIKTRRADSVMYKVVSEWDSVGRVSSQVEYLDTTELVARHFWVYDTLGRVVEHTMEHMLGTNFQPSMVETSEYGEDGFIKTQMTKSPNGDVRLRMDFTYTKTDDEGNWTERKGVVENARNSEPYEMVTRRIFEYY